MADQIDDHTHAELIALQNLVASDIMFVKQLQWRTTNYGLLLYGAIIALPKILQKPLHDVEYACLWFLSLLVLLAGIYVICELSKALTKSRDRLPAARIHFSDISLKAYAGGGDPNEALKSASEKSTFTLLFISVLVIGFVLVSWFLVRTWCNA